MTTFTTGDHVDTRTLETITGATVAVPDPSAVVHLQFRRFAGCPICHLHLREVARRHAEIADAGIHEVVVFHSAADALRRYAPEVPYDVVGDPERVLYREFGVESALGAVLHPRLLLAGARGMLGGSSLAGAVDRGEDHLGRPAEFLIGSDGTVLAAHYGRYADDQWTVDELLARHRG
ncbi:MAG: peroxiredoxin-like family protein [Pseudonocardia sp.]